jgi:hypothetical protein
MILYKTTGTTLKSHQAVYTYITIWRSATYNNEYGKHRYGL